MAELVKSERVDGPTGTRVQVLFYEDDSIRFRIYESPLVLEEAFLTGNRNDHAIIKVAPKRLTKPAPAGSEDKVTQVTELDVAKELLGEALHRFKWLTQHDEWFEDVRALLGK